MLEVHAILQRQRCNENITKKTGTLSDAYILSEDKKFAAVQLFQFVPYNYQPITSVQYYTNESASAVVAFLSKSKI